MVSDHCEYCGHRSAHYPSCRGEMDKRACAERDRYRDALEEFTRVAHFHRPDGSPDACVPCAATAALDGEG